MPRQHDETRPFSTRGFVSVLVMAMFLTMTATGLVLYVVPPGRVAHWIDWRMLGLDKEGWAAVHISSSLIFVAAGLVHLINNLKPLLRYLRERLAGVTRPRGEGLAAIAATLLVVAGTVADVPPFSYLMRVNEAAKAMWSAAASGEPPFPGAEQVPVTALADRLRLAPERVREALAAEGVEVGPRDSLKAVAAREGTTPAALHGRLLAGLARLEPSGPAWLVPGVTPEAVKAQFADSGAGRKTVLQMAQEMAVPVETAVGRLRAAGLDAGPDSRMKALADAGHTSPTELVAVIAIEGYRPEPGAAGH